MTASIPPPRGFSLTTYHTLGGAFLAPPSGLHLPPARGRPRRSCRPKRLTAVHSAGDNTSEEAKPECSYFVLNSSSGQVEEEPCVEWDFDNSTFSSTVGTEFQLACGWEYLRSTYQSIYMFGVTIGAPFNGVLADRYGRKMTVAVGFVAYSALAIGSCWIPNLSALLLSRFLMGAVHPTIQKTGYILGEGWRRREKAREKETGREGGEGMEVADPKWRTHIGIVLFLPWRLVSWRGAGSLTSSGNGGCFS
ncbi:putative solute carrier family 22 member 13-like [Penaeus vannamei]|uniref:Putative solute carrier family 22 member 13-like n=1 Tax=Penaeus vannamei TaxID=6689 RepID=A0A3R7QD25_PENVA|nr:putative solute carrier family 22 member 13-like [Penaeus vannamei]